MLPRSVRQQITSAANPLLKDVRRAISRGSLTSDGCCVAEGFHLLKEAARSGCAVPVVLASTSAVERVEQLTESRILELPDDLFQSLATTEASQGVMALVRVAESAIERLFEGNGLIMILDSVQDPGNAGTIARAAEAFGATGIIFVKGSTAPFHPKTLRASAGSLFRLPYLAGIEAGPVVDEVRERGINLYAAMPAKGPATGQAADYAARPREVDFSRPCAIVVGSEGHGVSASFSGASPVAIPTIGVESLNVGVAASILLYEAATQRTRQA